LPHRSLTVVPLISYQRYDGEATVRIGRDDGGTGAAGVLSKVDIEEMRSVKAGNVIEALLAMSSERALACRVAATVE
jgi:hypothetical protein